MASAGNKHRCMVMSFMEPTKPSVRTLVAEDTCADDDDDDDVAAL